MRVQPWEEVDLETHWGWLPVTGKVVLDVGADYGSTADFFLAKGAAGAIAVEGDLRLFRRLAALAERCGSLKAVHKRMASAADWQELLTSHSAQVVKVDCEGPEGFLLDLEDRLFRRPEAWAVELHTPQQAERWGNPFPWRDARAVWMGLVEKLLDSGYEIVKDVPHWTGRVVGGTRGDLLLASRPGDSEGSVKAVIAGTSPLGAPLLEEYLASRFDVEWGGEVLKPTPAFSTRTLADFFESGEGEARVCRLTYEEISDPLALWLQMKEVRIIHVVPEGWGGQARPAAADRLSQAQAERVDHLFQTGPYLVVTHQEMGVHGDEETGELPVALQRRLCRFLDLDWKGPSGQESA